MLTSEKTSTADGSILAEQASRMVEHYFTGGLLLPNCKKLFIDVLKQLAFCDIAVNQLAKEGVVDSSLALPIFSAPKSRREPGR